MAESAAVARRFHESAEGYGRGDAHAERIVALPDELLTAEGWKDGPNGESWPTAGWPSDELLVACGGEVASLPRSGLRDRMAVVCKDVRFGDRVFRAGDIVTNYDREHGIKEPRMSVFNGRRGRR